MAEPECPLLPVPPSDSPPPQRLVSGNVRLGLLPWLNPVSNPILPQEALWPQGFTLRSHQAREWAVQRKGLSHQQGCGSVGGSPH